MINKTRFFLTNIKKHEKVGYILQSNIFLYAKKMSVNFLEFFCYINIQLHFFPSLPQIFGKISVYISYIIFINIFIIYLLHRYMWKMLTKNKEGP